MVDVPAATEVTTPVLDTVATLGVALLQTPPDVGVNAAVTPPGQIEIGMAPLIVGTLGNGLTVTFTVAVVEHIVVVLVYV